LLYDGIRNFVHNCRLSTAKIPDAVRVLPGTFQALCGVSSCRRAGEARSAGVPGEMGTWRTTASPQRDGRIVSVRAVGLPRCRGRIGADSGTHRHKCGADRCTAVASSGQSGPYDDKCLTATLAARAALVVSGDRQLLAVSEWQGMRVLSPQQFIEAYLRGDGPGGVWHSTNRVSGRVGVIRTDSGLATAHAVHAGRQQADRSPTTARTSLPAVEPSACIVSTPTPLISSRLIRPGLCYLLAAAITEGPVIENASSWHL
jgi:hypothetical protein